MRKILMNRLVHSTENGKASEPEKPPPGRKESPVQELLRKAREKAVREQTIRASEREKRELTSDSPTAIAWRDSNTGRVIWIDTALGDDAGVGTKEAPVRTWAEVRRRAARLSASTAARMKRKP